MSIPQPCRIQIPTVDPSVTPLPQRGNNPAGVEIAANSRYLTLAGRPWLPVMGEFHFSRYPVDRWEEELLKMKAGGITVAATYIFWIHIEEIEGRFDWSGNNDLRRFVELCGRLGLYAYPRIGPWAHGECRNGGFPDWLLEACGSEVRQDAPLYLSYVRRFYAEIDRQLTGLLWKDGGPVIGIQLENELLDNPAHILTLKGMAREVGFDVPLYTMTGWGPAQIPDGQEILPVFGGYPDAFWDRQVDSWSRPSRKHYFFTHIRDDNTIGADLHQSAGTGDLKRLEAFPYGTCETGGGMQPSYHRRLFISADDIAALATVKVGNGSNLQGYYMYHGGANPSGRQTTMQESQATGYWNDLPLINYDFQAPIGQYGQVRPSYHALRLLHRFLHDFGAQLAPLPMTLPDVTPDGLDDTYTLRWAVRSDGARGFLFINNYQRNEPLLDHPNVQFEVALAGETLALPSQPVTIPAGLYAIWPLNLELEEMLLKYATAQPVCKVNTPDGPCYVFFAQEGIPAEFVFDVGALATVEGPARQGIEGNTLRLDGLQPGPGCLLRITSKIGHTVQVLLLSKADALQLYKAELWGQERLFLAAESLIFEDETLRIQTCRSGAIDVSVYPAPDHLSAADGRVLAQAQNGIFTRYIFEIVGREIPAEVVHTRSVGPARVVPTGPAGVAQAPEDADFEQAAAWQITLPPDALDTLDELFLSVEYVGDVARAYIADRLIDDDFYHSRAAWEIGLRRFAPDVLQHGLTLRILPLRKDAPIYIDPQARPKEDGQEAVVRINGVTAVPQYQVKLIQA